jgi:hypothetical protein
MLKPTKMLNANEDAKHQQNSTNTMKKRTNRKQTVQEKEQRCIKT